jgi:hypothetical protein
VAGTYQPPSAPRAAATLHVTPTPGRTSTSRRLEPRTPRPEVWLSRRSWHRWPPWPRPWGLSHHHRRR